MQFPVYHHADARDATRCMLISVIAATAALPGYRLIAGARNMPTLSADARGRSRSITVVTLWLRAIGRCFQFSGTDRR